MNQRRHLTLVAATATLMASAPIESMFVQWTWLVQSIIVVAMIFGAALGARALRFPVWAQPLATLAALLLGITWLETGGHAYAGLLPDASTFHWIAAQLSQAGYDMNQYSTPADDKSDFLLLAVSGIGIVAVLVDLLAVSLRRPALAGLPMLAIYAVPVGIDPHNLPFLPFAIGAAGFMWLLVTDNIDRVRMFGRRFSGDGRGLDMWEPSPLAVLGRRIALGGVALAVIVPFATPSLGQGLIPHLGGGNGTNGKGICAGAGCANSTSVNLFATLSGLLNKQQTHTMVTVTTNDPDPEYLRLAVSDVLTSAGFGPAAPKGQSISRAGIKNPFADDPQYASNIDYKTYTAQVKLTGLSEKLLPIYLSPTDNSLKGLGGDWLYDSSTQEIFTTGNALKVGSQYSFSYQRPYYSADELRKSLPLAPSDPIQAAYATVPQQVTEVNDVVRDRIAGKNTVYDKVLSLYQYFLDPKNGFKYKVTTADGTTGTAIGDFLQQKQGYCVQYAAALAWLVRAAGIPARVAVGFTQGARDPENPSTFILTNQNLHAWTEVYFADFGWVPFDATPHVNYSSRGAWEPDPSAITPTGSTPSSEASAGAGGPVRSHGPVLPSDGPNPVTLGHPNTPSGPPWGLYTLLALAVLIALALIPAAARLLLRRRRARIVRVPVPAGAGPGEPIILTEDNPDGSPGRYRIHATWDEFIDTLADYRVPVNPSETPLAATNRIARTLRLPEPVIDDLRRLGTSEQTARYARRPGPPESLDAGLRRFRKALALSVNWRIRLRATLLPPSTTERWSAATSRITSDLGARMSAVWEPLARAISLRRLVRAR